MAIDYNLKIIDVLEHLLKHARADHHHYNTILRLEQHKLDGMKKK